MTDKWQLAYEMEVRKNHALREEVKGSQKVWAALLDGASKAIARVEGERDTLRAALVGVLAELDEGYEHITESQPTRDSDEVEFARSVLAGSGQVEAEQ